MEKTIKKPVAVGVVSAETIMEGGDVLVLFGKTKDIKRLLMA
ncbi:hypothetical protein ACFSRY_05130 [Pontibacter locisalis]|uniref:RCK C-terminal domain-containing protein n=1 Tax=Pontibacter locisalis TaxID=1719035 RepID=A0ABW5IHX4_9BACT